MRIGGPLSMIIFRKSRMIFIFDFCIFYLGFSNKFVNIKFGGKFKLINQIYQILIILSFEKFIPNFNLVIEKNISLKLI